MQFKIETVLLLLTGISFEYSLDNAKKLIEYMTGEEASEITFVVGTRPELCKKEILKQHPTLTSFTTRTNINKDNYQDVLWDAIKTLCNDEIYLKPIESMPAPNCLK